MGAVIKMVRAILEYIKAKAGPSDKQNKIVRFVMCCCGCCLWCVEKCMGFINNQAYIQAALTGDSFCDSAKRAFWLIMRNIGEVGMMKLTATIFVWLGKLVIMGFSTMLCFLILTQVPTFKDQDRDTAVPNAFMSVYSQTIETVLMCFIHDKEATGGQFTNEKLRGTVSHLKKTHTDENSGFNTQDNISAPVNLA